MFEWFQECPYLGTHDAENAILSDGCTPEHCIFSSLPSWVQEYNDDIVSYFDERSAPILFICGGLICWVLLGISYA